MCNLSSGVRLAGLIVDVCQVLGGLLEQENDRVHAHDKGAKKPTDGCAMYVVL